MFYVDNIIHLITRLLLPACLPLAEALMAHWREPEQLATSQEAAAQVAAARSCAFLRCANLSSKGGPAAGQGSGSQRCRWVQERAWVTNAIMRDARSTTLQAVGPLHSPLRLASLSLQCLPRRLVLRYRLLACRLEERASAPVQGTGGGTAGSQGAAAAGCAAPCWLT